MNYADLRQAILRDLNRDDLVDVVDDYVQQIIAYYQKDFLLTSPYSETVVVTQGTAIYTLPTRFVAVDQMRLEWGGTWNLLDEVDYKDILAWDTNIPSTESIPTKWAPFGPQYRLWATPDTTYNLEITGPGRTPIPTSDTDSNFWTELAGPLIRHATTAQIRLLRLRDQAGWENDMIAADRERIKLLIETTQKESNDMVRGWW